MSQPPAPPRAPTAVRPATPNDVGAVAAIEQGAFSDPWSPRSFVSLLAQPGVCFLVADREGVVVGYAVAYHAADEAELANLAVAAGAQRSGVAARLLDVLEDRLQRAGVGEVWLEVRASNEPARALYHRRGFAEAGVRKRYYDHPVEDAIVMRRALRAQ